MNHTGKAVLLTAGLAFAVVPLLSQTNPAAKPSFEVISVKPSPPGNGPRGGGPKGDRFSMARETLRGFLQVAYQRFTPGTVSQLQIIGGPNWMETDRYDIEAKADCSGGPITREQFQLMVQSLLESRFQLKARLETRDTPVYELVVGKDGPKIKASEDQTPMTPGGAGAAGPPVLCGPPANFQPPAAPGPPAAPFDPTKTRGFMGMQYSATAATATANAVPITTLLVLLRLEAERPIIDKTNLKGLFDFKLQFSPERIQTPIRPAAPAEAPATAADPVPSLLTALQEQLGLKLESATAPIEVLVVESAQKPTEN